MAKSHYQFSFYLWFSTEPEQTDKQGIYWELMEGVRTEEMSGSNLHKLSKSSYQKRTKVFSYSLPVV